MDRLTPDPSAQVDHDSSPRGIAFSDPPGEEGLVNDNAFALLVAMLLDQQVSIEWAFRGPARLAERLGGDLTPAAVLNAGEDAMVTAAVTKPALHRYPAAMARRILALAQAISDDYNGETEAIWSGAATGAELADRLGALPGFGPEKVQITVAVLAKRFGHSLPGWEDVAGPFADDEPRSVADVGGPDDLARLREHRAAQKAAGRSKAE